MAISKRPDLLLSPSAFSKLQFILLHLQRGKHTSSGEKLGESIEQKDKGKFDPSNWKNYDSRAVHLKNSAIPRPAWTALSILRQKGFEAYLVGGCVRDLLLNRVPKDFDIITTASLKQVKRGFYRCKIVGRRFPIGHVHLFGTIIEVSSFQKEDQEDTKARNVISHETLKARDEIDILRWENSIQRDFTINGLFFDPFKYKVYDYLNGVKDLWSSKVRTVIPAHLSFKEDCARILRGLRIAARLGFHLCEETSKAVHKLSYLIHDLATQRLMLELDFMLCYGAARPSIQLLKKYRLLEIFLPFHAAYLDDQTKKGFDDTNTMLMKLFSNMDKLLAPDRPCDCTLWLGLLGFHVALINNPQKANVVQFFCALLYHGSWSEAMDYTKKLDDKLLVNFLPEMRKSSINERLLENKLRKEIKDFALLVKESMKVFTSLDFVNEYLARYPNAPKFCGKIVIFENKKKNAAQLFNGLDNEIESRKSYEIDYKLLKDGDRDETRFVLGKIIMDTINSTEKAINPTLQEEEITDCEDSVWVDSIEEEKYDKIKEIVDKINSEKGINRTLKLDDVLYTISGMEEFMINTADSDGEVMMDNTTMLPYEDIIRDMTKIDSVVASENVDSRERKNEGRVKQNPVHKNASKKVNKERQSHSLNPNVDFKKRDNKSKKYHTLHKKAVNKTVKNGSEINNASTKKESNSTDESTAKSGVGSSLSSLFK